MPGRGLFVEPAVFALIRFHDEVHAVAIANDTANVPAAGVCTNDIGRAHRVVRRPWTGTVWVDNDRKTNDIPPVRRLQEERAGRENGIDAVTKYSETKSMWIDTGNTITDPCRPRA